MRRVRYRVAASLDGYIAEPDAEIDWIVQDPATDLSAYWRASTRSCSGVARTS